MTMRLAPPGRSKRRSPRLAEPIVVGIEDRDVGGLPDREPAAPLDAEQIGRLRRQTLDRLFQRHDLPLAHPGAEQIGRIAGVAQHIDMRAAVAERDQHAGVGQIVGDELLVDVELRQHVADVEPVLERQIEERVERVLAARLRDIGDRPALVLLQLGLAAPRGR